MLNLLKFFSGFIIPFGLLIFAINLSEKERVYKKIIGALLVVVSMLLALIWALMWAFAAQEGAW